MGDMTDMTIGYYNKNAADFAASTAGVDLSAQYAAFLQYLRPGDSILDLGCGSGRDSKFFLEHGYRVEAIDGSSELCAIASEYIKQPVRHLLFQDLDYINAFEAVWACSSLLHVEKNSLPTILAKIGDALKPNGILYASFKYGTFSGERNGRYFLDLTENGLNELAENSKVFHVQKASISHDARPDRSNEKWLNAFLVKR